MFYIANSCYVCSTAFIKLSLLFQYLRIFEKGTAIRKLCIALIVLVSLWGFAYAFMAWVPCFPIHNMWDITPGAKCYSFGSQSPDDFAATFESHTAVNVLFDVLVLAIPIPLYFEKDTPMKARIGLVVLLLMGCL